MSRLCITIPYGTGIKIKFFKKICQIQAWANFNTDGSDSITRVKNLCSHSKGRKRLTRPTYILAVWEMKLKNINWLTLYDKGQCQDSEPYGFAECLLCYILLALKQLSCLSHKHLEDIIDRDLSRLRVSPSNLGGVFCLGFFLGGAFQFWGFFAIKQKGRIKISKEQL